MKRVAAAAVLVAASCGTSTIPEPSHSAFSDGPKHNVPRSQDNAESYIVPPSRVAKKKVSRSRAATPVGGHSPSPSAGDVWTALAQCESGNRNDAGAPYYGYFQFSAPTWRSMGHTGTADQHPYDVQLEAARRLQARSGWGQWPACARRLGLL